MFKVFDYAVESPQEGAENRFEVVIGEMYPAILSHIQTCLENGVMGGGVIRDSYYPKAQALPSGAFDLALIPYAQATALPFEDRETRNAALELGRVWFTELLHRAIGGDGVPLHVVLLPDTDFKLTAL